VRVARVEPAGDAPAGAVEHDVLGLDRPLAVEHPVVRAPAATVAQIRLERVEVVPIGRRLHADSFDRDQLALDAVQPLDDPLRLLVASFAEVVVADETVLVDEVQRRPVAVREGTPDLVVVVDRDRVVDRALLRRVSHAVDVVLEGELGRVDADDDQAVVSVGPRPGAHVRLLAQPVDARPRPEVDEDDMAPQLGGAERLGIEPRGRPAERGHVHMCEHGHLTEQSGRGDGTWTGGVRGGRRVPVAARADVTDGADE
jgi:hypothetical protein